MVNVADPKNINVVDLSAELGVEQVIIDRLGSFLGTDDPRRARAQPAERRALRRGPRRRPRPRRRRGVRALRRPEHRAAQRHRQEPHQRRQRRPRPGHRQRRRHHGAAAGRDLPGPAGLPPAAEPDPPGARGRARGRQRAAARDGRQDPGRRGPGRDHPDPGHHPRGDGPAGPRRGRHAPAGRAPGVRRGQAALPGRRDVLDPVPPQHLADQPAARPHRAAGEGRGGPQPPRVPVPPRPPRLAHAPYGRLADGAGRRADADQRHRRARPRRRVPGRDGRCAGVPARPDRVRRRPRRSTAPRPPTWCT